MWNVGIYFNVQNIDMWLRDGTLKLTEIIQLIQYVYVYC